MITEFTKDARQAIEDRLKGIMGRMTLAKKDMAEVEKELRSSLYEQAESAATERGSATVTAEDVEKVCAEERPPGEIASCYIKTYLPNLERAGFWPKAVAYAIDSAILLALQLICIYVALKLIYPGTFVESLTDAAPFVVTLIRAFMAVTAFCYFIFLEVRFGKTVGKHLLGLTVLKADGARIGYREAFLRNITPALGFYQVYVILDALAMLVFFNHDRQRAFDRVASTIVVCPGSHKQLNNGERYGIKTNAYLGGIGGRLAAFRAMAAEATGLRKHLLVAGKIALLMFTVLAAILIIVMGLFIGTIFIYLTYAIVTTGTIPADGDPFSGLETNLWFSTIVTVLQNIVFVTVAAIFLAVVDKKPLLPGGPMGRILGQAARWFALGVLLDSAVILSYVAFVLVTGLSAVQANGLWTYATDTLVFSIVMTVVMTLSIGIGEEVFFRKYIQGYLSEKYGIAIAIVVASILFTIPHIDPFTTMEAPLAYFGLFIWSLAVGYIYAVTGSIWACIGFHFFEDLVLFSFPAKEALFGVKPILLLSGTEDIVLFNVAVGGPEDVFNIIVLLALLAGLYLYNKNRRMVLKRPETA